MEWKEKLTRPFDLYEISRARPYLMGIATLWITFYHSVYLNLFESSFLTKTHLLSILTRVESIGNCGVDLFFFLSALGLYFSYTGSLEKEPHPVRSFYARRFGRILPALLLASVLTYAMLPEPDLANWAGTVFLYGFFVPGLSVGRFWYLSATLALYLVFPLLHRALRGKRSLLRLLAVLGGIAAVTLLFRYVFSDFYFAHAFYLFLNRLPVFVLGAYTGKLCYERRKAPAWAAAAAVPLAVLLVFVIADFPLQDYQRLWEYILLVPCFVLAHAAVLSRFRKWGFVTRSVMTVGTFSMEIYLIYESVYYHATGLFVTPPDATGLAYALTCFTATLALAVLLKTVAGQLTRVYRAQGDSAPRVRQEETS